MFLAEQVAASSPLVSIRMLTNGSFPLPPNERGE
jgi:hypothetical protein